MRFDVPDPSPDRARLSWSFATLQSFCPLLTSAGIGSARPSCPLTRQAGLQGCRRQRPPARSKCPSPASSHGLARSFRVLRASSRRFAAAPSRARSDVAAPPMRFAPLQRLPARSSSFVAGFASPDRLRPQVFSTSRRLSIRREPAGLVSCRIRSWGCALQSFPPTAWPYAVSGADPLVVLVPARHHLYVPLPLTPAKAEASSNPDGRCRSTRAEALADRNRCRPPRRYRSTAEPNGRPTLGSRSSFETDSGSTLQGRNPFEPNGRPTLGSRSSLAPSRARPPEPEGPFGSAVRPPLQSRSPFEPNVRPNSTSPKRCRTERPLDPPEPKLRRTRRPALPTQLRRATWLGHRPDPRKPEGIR
jgi:hypothetical protein